ERAKTLLKRYYARVTESNKLFTSYLPGWKTDRGMIYIVFGAPNNMYKFNGGETWVYGEETQSYAVRFHFKKVINPFSDNDYIMERNEYYKEAWYRAVDYWRQGHIYIDN
ncbi:MAG TPA: GWxTD domain-containing protein, partial [Bacteroidia bacterium]|nr:GWxTD domain-containing protein [Bacteroidia bacterium]